MDEREGLTEGFERERTHLRAVAYRMLGQTGEADDAVQEAWLRLERSGEAGEIENLRAWLTTVVARVCLNMLRSRRTRAEAPLDDAHVPEPIVVADEAAGPEGQALLADSVGLALLVVLDSLAPDERLAFVLHDMFAVPFEEIAPMVDRSPAAARQLASRARRRLRGSDAAADRPDDPARRREVVDAFFAAAREGDFEGLLEVLDPEVVHRVDSGDPATSRLLRGAEAVAGGARAGAALGRTIRRVLVNGEPGALLYEGEALVMLMAFTVAADRIVEIDSVVDPDRLARIEV